MRLLCIIPHNLQHPLIQGRLIQIILDDLQKPLILFIELIFQSLQLLLTFDVEPVLDHLHDHLQLFDVDEISTDFVRHLEIFRTVQELHARLEAKFVEGETDGDLLVLEFVLEDSR